MNYFLTLVAIGAWGTLLGVIGTVVFRHHFNPWRGRHRRSDWNQD